jgi:hypothetical protein
MRMQHMHMRLAMAMVFVSPPSLSIICYNESCYGSSANVWGAGFVWDGGFL